MDENQKIKVAIVDDHEIVRIGLKLVIEKWPEMEIVGEAADGVRALELLEKTEPNVVLMDLAMPGTDGIQATRAIRAVNQNVGIIVLTSHTHAEDIRAALAAGVNGYCLKDVDDERLKRAIMSVAEGDIWLDSRVAQAALDHATDGSADLSYTARKLARESSADQEITREEEAVVESPQEGPPKIFAPLSERELEVLALLVKGLTNKEIGEQLFITRDTVKTHIRHIMEKLAAKDRTEAAVKAVQHKLI